MNIKKSKGNLSAPGFSHEQLYIDFSRTFFPNWVENSFDAANDNENKTETLFNINSEIHIKDSCKGLHHNIKQKKSVSQINPFVYQMTVPKQNNRKFNFQRKTYFEIIQL